MVTKSNSLELMLLLQSQGEEFFVAELAVIEDRKLGCFEMKIISFLNELNPSTPRTTGSYKKAKHLPCVTNQNPERTKKGNGYQVWRAGVGRVVENCNEDGCGLIPMT